MPSADGLFPWRPDPQGEALLFPPASPALTCLERSEGLHRGLIPAFGSCP